jgi:hypothetical protein
MQGLFRGRNSARVAAALALAVLTLGGSVGSAAAADWCDEGSPPPNDFRLQPTGGNSNEAPPMWLRSTTNGDELLQHYQATGGVDVSQMQTLSGGVASGMTQASAAR